MTIEQRDRSIQTGYLQLDKRDKLNHFSSVLFLCLLSSIVLFVLLCIYISGKDTELSNGDIGAGVVLPVLTFLSYRLQKSRLRFKAAATTLGWPQVLAMVKSIAKEQKWVDRRDGDRIFTAKTDPSVWSGSRGEQITVLYDNGNVYINSICDLDKRSSVVSFGRNADNMEAVMKGIGKAALGEKGV